ncbi:hypothetical protein EXIGLDRAFT_776846 [Exidia glandulosa HHB12029]|uniref:Uncharacterized protein n=1 Tax=Exidia glandulosa HHB12029 TaxID=1314781 RepID=A0A165DB94_EXIGL|nr:hypothetical protein EXIGLDRAFT_776846 [Exidia glandulosa HHB12029]
MPLPALPTGNWPAQFHEANDKLVEAYTHGKSLLGKTDVDPIRLQIQFDRILGECKPLLEGLERSDVPRRWVHKCARKLARQAGLLMHAAEAARGVDHTATRQVEPTTIVYTGRPGRPKKIISASWMRNAFGRRRALKQSVVAQLAGVSRHTLRARMKDAGITKHFTPLTNDELDRLVKQ